MALPSGGAGSFQVTLARSEAVVTVESDVTILDAIRTAGFDHPSSCEMGICGACEVKVLAGEVDHRDDLLSDDEKANGSTMMICVSRACGDRLVIDL
ncbi:2Fe-2S iron-sulfur cluster-binding protein [Aeromicrobium sp. UC242_57]|uniref:2Fe-2S iron-sulfur cluster-binding protein n=1 Tax=Aeromicrobium sp. UC242_57 TaxID=3374624 RepID=UPI0037BE6C22